MNIRMWKKKLFMLQILPNIRRLYVSRKPYECEKCGRPYIWSSNFAIQQGIHAGKKPYKCKQCGKTFIWASYLAQHEKSCERKFCKCKECGKTFLRGSELNRHQKIHPGERKSLQGLLS